MPSTSAIFRRPSRPLALSLAVAGLLVHLPAADSEFTRTVRPFLATHCTGCHGEKKQKGDLRIDTLAHDFVDAKTAMHWGEIMDRINSGDMPPKKEPRPTGSDIAQVAEWITARLTEGEATRQASEGEKISFRRLSRDEYRNTIRDLLGVTYDASDPSGLPEDPDWHGFERIGSVLTVSPAHIEKYFAAAESVLDECLAVGPRAEVETRRWTPRNHRVRHDVADVLAAKGLLERTRIDIVPNNGSLDAEDIRIETTGDYRFRVKLSALRPAGGRAPRLRVYAANLGRVLFERDVEAPEDQPITIEFRTHLPAGTHLVRICNAVPGPNPEERASRPLNSKPFFHMKARQPWQIKLTDEDYQPSWPTILLDWMSWEGPVQASWPPPAHQRIFFAGPASGDAAKDSAYAREILGRFVARAWRRPVQPAEIDRLFALVERERTLGSGFEASLRTALLSALCSKNFLYLIEGSANPTAGRIDDWELASRLSYFLWSTMPDGRLLDLAHEGRLHRPEVLRGEVRRMLADPRARAFADSFPRQWLHLRAVGMFAPDRKLYPDYDEYLESSMIGETTAFFREVLERDLGLREFLDSDWTMLNERLAGHYGIDGVRGEAMRRVALGPEHHRGGLLTQAAILSQTSDGTRHRPVHRGKWVLESIIGKPPPPPPANVPAIGTSAANQPKMSLRAKLEAHREDENCGACHRKIDPLGLAFEHYDAVGHWRTAEVVRDGSGADPLIDASGELPDGRTFSDAAGLKRLLVADLDRFAAAFAEKLATYALRRGMTFADRTLVTDLAARARSTDYRLATLVEQLVTSDLFQKR
jgi:mono/diheme cytochrome c family protein